jgi:hypothetical protein
LIGQKQFEQAEALALRHYHGFIPQTPALLVKLYREWQKLDRLEAELPKFYLPEGVRNEALFLARQR